MRHIGSIGVGILVLMAALQSQAQIDEFAGEHSASNKPAIPVGKLRSKDGAAASVKVVPPVDKDAKGTRVIGGNQDKSGQGGMPPEITPPDKEGTAGNGAAGSKTPPDLGRKIRTGDRGGKTAETTLPDKEGTAGNGAGGRKGPDKTTGLIVPDGGHGRLPPASPPPVPAWGHHSVVLPANWQFAWEYAVPPSGTTPGADLMWRYVDAGKQYLEPLNGGKLAIVTGYENTSIEQMGSLPETLPASAFSTARIAGGAMVGSKLRPGTKLVMITGEGDRAVMEIEGYRSSHDFSYPGADVLNGIKATWMQQPESPFYQLQIGGLWGKAQPRPPQPN